MSSRFALFRKSASLLWAAAALLGVAGALLAAPGAATAQGLTRSESRGLLRACRDDYRTFCRDVRPGGGAILDCLRQHDRDLSPDCRAAGAAMLEQAAPESGPDSASGGQTLRDIAYGPDPLQRIDVYAPESAVDAPMIVMVHGGAWMRGSKSSNGVVGNKAAHWLAEGYVFVSVGYRLLPQADPVEQARDVARALAAVQAQAASWGADPNRLVLVGHSAGAHLVALLAADPSLTRAAGARPVRGVVALDSAAYDVVRIMTSGHARLYDRVFGDDPDYWRAASPTLVLSSAPPPMLLVCSTRHSTSCAQANALTAKARQLGGEASALPVDLSHRQINVELGLSGAYTQAVDGFLRTLGAP